MAAFLLLGAGCIEQRSQNYQVYASEGSFASGFAYDGEGIVPLDGAAFLDVNDQANTGRLVVDGRLGNREFDVRFANFSESKPFHDGGIAADLAEHGASGVGDKSIPQVDLEMAAWGKATVTYGGNLLKDPATGADQWTAHFMVIRNGVRDNATGAIYADANRTTPYDPMDPTNGTTAPHDYELHLVLRNQTSNGTANGFSVKRVDCCQNSAGPFAGTHELFSATSMGSHAQVYVNLTSTPVTATNLTFDFKRPSGSTITTQRLGPAQVGAAPSSGFMVSFSLDEIGSYTVAVAGRFSPGSSYTIEGNVDAPAAVVLNLWWENLIFGTEALQRATAEGLTATETNATSEATQ